ncbi:MAG TPA: WD40 repeat domain-containing protein, partial [Armatimonadota bacterium]|nr:WD40 repeat domain-containing protein [Armatimonadota bacterium]
SHSSRLQKRSSSRPARVAPAHPPGMWKRVPAGARIMLQEGYNDPVDDLSFSADGSTVLSRWNDVIKVWDASSWDLRFSLDESGGREEDLGPPEESELAAALSRNGGLLAVASASGVQVWNTRTAKRQWSTPLRWPEGTGPGDIVFAPSVLWSDTPNGLESWDAASGRRLKTLAGGRLSRDRTTLVLGAGRGRYRLVDVGTGRQRGWLRTTDRTDGFYLSPHDRVIAGKVGDTLKLWRVRDGALLHTLTVGENLFEDDPVAFSPDGRLVAAFSVYLPDFIKLDDGKMHLVHRGSVRVPSLTIWDVSSGKRLPKLPPGWAGRMPRLLPPGTRLKNYVDDQSNRDLEGSYGIDFWHSGAFQFRPHTVTPGHPGDHSAMAVSPDGSRAVTAYGELWRLHPLQILKRWPGARHPFEWIDFSADGRLIAGLEDADYLTAVFPDGLLRSAAIWDTRTGEWIDPARIKPRYEEGGRTPDLFAANLDARDMRTPTLHLPGKWTDPGRWSGLGNGMDVPVDPLYSTATELSADGRRATPFAIPEMENWPYERMVHYSDDGKRIFVVRGNIDDQDDPVEVWDLPTRRRAQVFGSEIGVPLALIQHGQTLVSVTGDASSRLTPRYPAANAEAHFWSVATGKLIREVSLGENSRRVTVSSNGARIAVQVQGDSIRIYDAVRSRLIRSLPVPASARNDYTWPNAPVVALSPDGSRIAIADGQGAIRIRATDSGRLLMTWGRLPPSVPGGKSTGWIAWTPNGYYEGSAGVEREIRDSRREWSGQSAPRGARLAPHDR